MWRFIHSGVPQGQPGTFLYESQYQAQGWSRARRVVLVVSQREDELFPHAFWLVTSWTREQMPAEELLTHYRQRGTAEGHFGELMDVLAPALSSARRPKSNYQGQPPVRRSVSIEAFANNEVRLLLNALAYNLVHAARVLLEQATGEGWGLRRVRQRVLKVAARVLALYVVRHQPESKNGAAPVNLTTRTGPVYSKRLGSRNESEVLAERALFTNDPTPT